MQNKPTQNSKDLLLPLKVAIKTLHNSNEILKRDYFYLYNFSAIFILIILVANFINAKNLYSKENIWIVVFITITALCYVNLLTYSWIILKLARVIGGSDKAKQNLLSKIESLIAPFCTKIENRHNKINNSLIINLARTIFLIIHLCIKYIFGVITINFGLWRTMEYMISFLSLSLNTYQLNLTLEMMPNVIVLIITTWTMFIIAPSLTLKGLEILEPRLKNHKFGIVYYIVLSIFPAIALWLYYLTHLEISHLEPINQELVQKNELWASLFQITAITVMSVSIWIDLINNKTSKFVENVIKKNEIKLLENNCDIRAVRS